MLDQLREGDTVVVRKLYRLSQSLKDVLHIMERIEAGTLGVWPQRHGNVISDRRRAL